MLLYIVVVKVLSIFTDVNTRIIKGVQTGGHETKIFFLKKTINCPSRMQSILKLASSSKTNFSKGQILWTGAYKNRLDKPGRMV